MLRLIAVPTKTGSLGKNTGCEKAPEILLQFLHQKPVQTIPVFEEDIEKTQLSIFKNAQKIFRQKKNLAPLVFVGGDHSITYSLFKAFAQTNRNAGLLVFDAHADSATFFHPVSHEDINRVLIEEKILPPKNLLLVGVRKVWPVEQKFLKQKRIKVIRAHQVKRQRLQTEKQLGSFLDSVSKLYVSIDIDVLDPKWAPATGYPEKNGLQKKEFFELLDLILKSKKAAVFDLVEVNPQKKGSSKTVKTALELIYFLG